MSSHYDPEIYFKSTLEASALHPRFGWFPFEPYEDHFLWTRNSPTGQALWILTNSDHDAPKNGSGFFQRYEAIKEKYDD